MVCWVQSQEELQERPRKTKLLHSQVSDTGGTPHHTGPHGEAPGWSGGRGAEAKGEQRPQPLSEFPQEEEGRAGKQLR